MATHAPRCFVTPPPPPPPTPPPCCPHHGYGRGETVDPLLPAGRPPRRARGGGRQPRDGVSLQLHPPIRPGHVAKGGCASEGGEVGVKAAARVGGGVVGWEVCEWAVCARVSHGATRRYAGTGARTQSSLRKGQLHAAAAPPAAAALTMRGRHQRLGIGRGDGGGVQGGWAGVSATLAAPPHRAGGGARCRQAPHRDRPVTTAHAPTPGLTLPGERCQERNEREAGCAHRQDPAARCMCSCPPRRWRAGGG